MSELEHSGVKGMKWGVRRSTNKKIRTKEEKKDLAKKTALVFGTLVVLSGSIYAGKTLKNRNVSVTNLSKKTSDYGKAASEKIMDEQKGFVWATRGRNTGMDFPLNGSGYNSKRDSLKDYETVFGKDGSISEPFQKLNDGRVAVQFNNPDKLKDHAGRVIPHQIIIPKSMASNVNNLDDFMNDLWPIFRYDFDKIHKAPYKN